MSLNNIETEDKTEFLNSIKNSKYFSQEWSGKTYEIYFHTKKWSVNEEHIAKGDWNDKEYEITASVNFKTVLFSADAVIQDIIDLLTNKELNDIGRDDIEDFDLSRDSDGGSSVEIEDIEWNDPLSSE